MLRSLCLLLALTAFASQAPASEEKQALQTLTRADARTGMKGPADYFTGKVLVEPLFPATDAAPFSGAYVTFEPGARSAWHVHPTGQRLLVTAGFGLTQQWGGPVEEIKAGDVV